MHQSRLQMGTGDILAQFWRGGQPIQVNGVIPNMCYKMHKKCEKLDTPALLRCEWGLEPFHTESARASEVKRHYF